MGPVLRRYSIQGQRESTHACALRYRPLSIAAILIPIASTRSSRVNDSLTMTVEIPR